MCVSRSQTLHYHTVTPPLHRSHTQLRNNNTVGTCTLTPSCHALTLLYPPPPVNLNPRPKQSRRCTSSQQPQQHCYWVHPPLAQLWHHQDLCHHGTTANSPVRKLLTDRVHRDTPGNTKIDHANFAHVLQRVPAGAARHTPHTTRPQGLPLQQSTTIL